MTFNTCRIRKLFFLVSILTSFTGWAVEGSSQFVMCKNKDIVRTIRIEQSKTSEYSCETIYTKAGNDKIVSQAKNEYSCTSVLKNIQDNLVGAGWNCKEVPGARVTAGSEKSGE